MEYINRKSELGNNDFDGVIQLQDLTGMSPLGNGNDPVDNTLYYSANGKRVKRRRPLRRLSTRARKDIGTVFNKGQQIGGNIAKRRQERKLAKIDVRQTRVGAKETSAQASKTAARNVGKTDPAIVAALSASAPAPKSNTGLYIGLGLGVLALGVGIYFVVKSKKK